VVLEATKGRSELEIQRALAAAYPFTGSRGRMPHNAWREEIRRQRGALPKPKAVGQRNLFEEGEG